MLEKSTKAMHRLCLFPFWFTLHYGTLWSLRCPRGFDLDDLSIIRAGKSYILMGMRNHCWNPAATEIFKNQNRTRCRSLETIAFHFFLKTGIRNNSRRTYVKEKHYTTKMFFCRMKAQGSSLVFKIVKK